MNYAIYIERYAQKQIMQLNKIAIPVLKNAIETLGNDPRPFGYIKLKGEESYRIKVGDYRIIYEIDDKNSKITIIAATHRKKVYSKK